jgi:hypothetical protein
MKSTVHLTIDLDHDSTLPLDADGIADSVARTLSLALKLRGDSTRITRPVPGGRTRSIGGVSVKLDSAAVWTSSHIRHNKASV